MVVYIGTSGFSFDDWKGPVYPSDSKKEDMLHFYANELKFNSVELNFTYYALPSEKSFMGMQKKVPADFIFTVKGYRGFTHDPFDPRCKTKATRKKSGEDLVKFTSALNPLRKEKQLGGVLLQFPVFFEPSPDNCDYIIKCKYMMTGIPVVIEFRNIAWAKKETFEFLIRNNLGYCIVDEPKLSRLMPYYPQVTSKQAYFRFHGRNNNWFNASLEERYNYLYPREELKGFIKDIKRMEAQSKDFFIYFNNCHMGQAAKNAKDLQELLMVSEGM